MGYGGGLAMAQGPSQDDASESSSPTLGGYARVRELVRAPGMILAEGRGEPEGRVLLQLVPLRPAQGAEAEAAEADYVQMLARATALLVESGESAPLAHGAAALPGLGTVAFWVLPWVEGADAPRPHVDSADALSRAATALLERLRARHAAGRLDPLLSASAVVASPKHPVAVMGLPLHLPADGLDPALAPAVTAPEEAEPSAAGDLWRAGRALIELSAGLASVPAPLQAILQRLAAPELEARYPSAEQALLELEALDATVGASPDLEQLPTLALDPEGPDGLPEPGQPITAPEEAAEEEEEHEEEDSDSLELDTSPEMKAGDEPATPSSRAESAFPSPVGDDRPPRPLPEGRRSAPEERDLATVRVPFPNELKRKAEEELARERAAEAAKVTTIRAPSTLDSGEGETQLDLKRPAHRPLKGVAFTQTVVDQRAVDASSEATLQDVPLSELEGADEFPTMDEIGPRRDPAGPRTAWDRARKDPPFDPTQNRGNQPRLPPATSPMGPRGTVVGVRIINDPTGLRATADLPGMLPPPKVGPSGATPPPPEVSEGLQVPKGRTLGPDTSMALPSAPKPVPAAPPPAGPVAGPLALPPAAQEGRPLTHDLDPPAQGALAIPAGPTLANAPGLAPPPLGAPPAPAVPAGALVPRSLPPSMSPAAAPRPAPSAPPAPAPTPSGRRHLIPGAIGFFVAGGLAAAALNHFQSAQPVILEGPNATQVAGDPVEYVATPANEVLLQASPASAVVVGEGDGRPLGRTPMRFLVPPGMDAAILVAADGHEPQRVALPVRGRIRTDLVPLDKAAPCEMTLAMKDPMDLEGVAADVRPAGSRHSVPGAAVVRAKGRPGAWLVRCPRLGGTDPQALTRRPPVQVARLSIVGPSNATVYVDDKEIGVTPVAVEVQTGFRKVTVEKLSESSEKTERWVPVFGETKVRMPRPRGEGQPE